MNKLPDEYIDRILDGQSRLQAWRKHRGMLEQELADKAGIPVERLRALEAEMWAPREEEIARLSAVLHVEPADIAPMPDDSV